MMNNAHVARIKRLLQEGHIIRVIDGRCGNGFVDTKTLNEMIAEKKVKVIRKQGMKFATLKAQL
jgi:hypothetical protein